MNSILFEIAPLFQWLLKSTLQVSVVIIIVFAVKAIFSKKLTPRWHYILWMLVIAKMVIPVSLQSSFSLFNLMPTSSETKNAVVDDHASSSKDSDVIEQMPLADNAEPVDTVLSDDISKVEVESSTASIANNDIASSNNTIAAADTQGIDSSQPVTIEKPEQQPTISAANYNLDNIMPYGWLIGAGLLSLYVLASNYKLWRIIRVQRPVTDSGVLDLLEDCKAQMDMHAYLAVVETDKVTSPALYGFLRPRLLLPTGILSKLNKEQLRHVFLHELAHLKRGDIYFGWLTALLQTLHWFNPLVWYAFHKMRVDRELACDELAISAMKSGENNEYGKTIVSLLEDFSAPQYTPGLAGILEEKSQLRHRISMIANGRKGSTRLSVFAAVLMMVIGGVALTDASQEPKPLVTISANSDEVILENGTRIELLGLCEQPLSKESKWWKQNGEVLREAPFDDTGDKCYPKEGESAYVLAIKYSDIAPTMVSDLRVDGLCSASGGTIISYGIKDGEYLLQKKNGKLYSTVTYYTVVLPKEQTSCNLDIYYTEGEWETEFKTKSGNLAQGTVKGSVVFGEPYIKDGKATVSVSDSIGGELYNRRIIAKDTYGNIIEPCKSSGRGSNGTTQTTVSFDCNISDIKSFEFQTRKYKKIRIENVVLKQLAAEKESDSGNPNQQYHTVQLGDTLSSIAKKYYGDGKYFNNIIKANTKVLDEAKQLKEGMKLVIPKLESNIGSTNCIGKYKSQNDFISVSGTVTMPDGSPVSGQVMVAALPMTDSFVYVGELGKYILNWDKEWAPENDERVKIFAQMKSKKLAALIDREPGQQKVDIQLKPAIDLSGTVVGPDGKPIAGVEVVISFHGERWQCFTFIDDIKTGTDGRFTIPCLPANENYSIKCYADGYLKVKDRYEIEAEHTAADYTIPPLTLIPEGTNDDETKSKPTKGVVYVMGKVSRPGPYSMINGRLTLKQMIATVGGPNGVNPDKAMVKLEHQNEDETSEIIKVSMTELFAEDSKDYPLQADDVIYVYSSSDGETKPSDIFNTYTDRGMEISANDIGVVVVNGVKVGLLGVLNQSQPNMCWTPDGTVLDEMMPRHIQDGTYQPKNGRAVFEFTVKLSGLPEDNSVKIKASPYLKKEFSALSPISVDGENYDHYALWQVFNQMQDKCDLTVSVACGEWITVGVGKYNDSEHIVIKTDDSVRDGVWLSPLAEKPVKDIKPWTKSPVRTVVSLTHGIMDKDVRLIAIGKDGTRYQKAMVSGAASLSQSFSEVVVTTCQFDLAMKDIDSLELQVRPYRSVTFTDVALFPNQSLGDNNKTLQPKTYIVEFKALASVCEKYPKGLIDILCEGLAQDLELHKYAAHIDGVFKTGIVHVDTEKGKDILVEHINKSEKLKLIRVRQATESYLENLNDPEKYIPLLNASRPNSDAVVQDEVPVYSPLDKLVSVDIDHSPKNTKLSVQYGVIAICEAAGVGYDWDTSGKLADPERRKYIPPIHFKNKNAHEAINEIITPLGLSYGIKDGKLYLYKKK